MFRRRTAALLLAGAALALAACAPDPAAVSAPSAAAEPDGEVTVFAAASLKNAFDEVIAAFEQENPRVTVSAVYDGSSTLVTQILEGAPADVFASADEATMAAAADLVVDPAVFATNTLVIIVPAGNPAGVASLDDLAEGAAELTTVLCAPEVPCGAASATLLSNAGVAVSPASLEQNVTAVRTKVAAGEADAGLVYATDAIGTDEVEAIVPEGAADVVNRYPIATLADASNPDAAASFTAFVRSDAVSAILARRGFGLP